MIFDN